MKEERKKALQRFPNKQATEINEILEYLDKKAEENKKLLAYHYPCPDGVVTATLVSYALEQREKGEITPVPLSYDILKEPTLRKQITEMPQWKIIADLEPFTPYELDLYLDHHISNQGKNVNAKFIIFNRDAPSAASLLVDHNPFQVDYPPEWRELAELTRITDTASYRIDPPLTEYQPPFNFDELTWVLTDASFAATSLAEVNQLIERLVTRGVAALSEKWTRELAMRSVERRKKAIEQVENEEIHPFMIVISEDSEFDTKSAINRLMKKGALVTAGIKILPGIVKIALRISKAATPEQILRYRVDELAKMLNGGGHLAAAGAATATIEEALEKLQEYARKKGLTSRIIWVK